ncbi:hypothetical protein [Heliophilum fasciatum]|uniref:Uncharacterized protein n=1 Tax=Heliophilum fasciatum TaxID=35700 RepID=A0A4R2RX03_9FIRM|nr:hypothetical protein [Heliophilum fasciatum]MCW2276617.1 hypothetical protein [Heliophilum fasciatum]TCP69000.1 hypothetical protein EDD73_101168 [Heliophilum fasciatum]
MPQPCPETALLTFTDQAGVQQFQYQFTFVGVTYDSATGFSTFTYNVCKPGTDSTFKDLSHFVIGFSPDCPIQLTPNQPGVEFVNPDPTTGAVGIKIDTPVATAVCPLVNTYSFTLNGFADVGPVTITAKDGAQGGIQFFTSGTICGPICTPVPGARGFRLQ